MAWNHLVSRFKKPSTSVRLAKSRLPKVKKVSELKAELRVRGEKK